MKILVLGVLVFIGLFVLGFVSPRRSHRVERKLKRRVRRGERKADDKESKLGDATRKSLEMFRRGSEKSVRAGREVRDKVEPNGDGARVEPPRGG